MTDAATDVPLRRNRDFHLIWAGGLLAGLGSLIGGFAVPLLVLRETGSPTQAGLVGSVSSATVLIAIVPAGAVADAVERRDLIICCQLAGGAIAAGFAVTVLAGHSTLALVLLVTVLGAVLGSLYAPAANALLRAAVPDGQLGLATSRLQARTAGIQVAGPLIGGVLFGVSPGVPFAVRAAALLGSVGCLLAVRARSVPARAGNRPLSRRHLLAGFRFVWGQPYLRVILLVFGGGLGCAFPAVMLVAVMATAQADPSGRSSGALVAVTSIGTLAGALLAPRLPARGRPHRALILTCWACAVFVPTLAVITVPLVMAALLGVVLLLAAVGNVAFETELVRLTPSDLLGRTEAGAMFISMVAAPLGPLGAGALVERCGYAVTFTVLGVVIAVLAATLTILLRRCSVAPGSATSGSAVSG